MKGIKAKAFLGIPSDYILVDRKGSAQAEVATLARGWDRRFCIVYCPTTRQSGLAALQAFHSLACSNGACSCALRPVLALTVREWYRFTADSFALCPGHFVSPCPRDMPIAGLMAD